jgi:hypothetical protein
VICLALPLRLTLPIRTVSEANCASHEHWRKRQRRAKMQKEQAFLTFRGLVHGVADEHGKLHRPLIVSLIRIAPRDLDSDNLPVSMKAVRDGIAAAIGVDDGTPSIEWRYGQRRVHAVDRPAVAQLRYGVCVMIAFARE